VRTPKLATHSVRVLAAELLVAGVRSPESPHTGCRRCSDAGLGPRHLFTIAGDLYGVAATSASNAWAVGNTNSGKKLSAHWNGTTWTEEPGAPPQPRPYGRPVGCGRHFPSQ
jgi:hypothetical protein